MTISCYLCDGTDFKYRPGIVRDNDSLDILECQECKLVFLSQRDIYEDFYKQAGMHGIDQPSIESLMRETDRDNERRFRYLSEMIINRDILDFGCGMGGFLFKARPYARSVAGVELEERLSEHFRTSELDVLSSLDDIPEKSLDLITAFHVVEHLRDPIGTLQKMAQKLRDGRIVIEVPSSNDALLTLYESQPFSEFTYWSCHLYLFNSSNLALLAQKAGLKVEYIKHIQRYPLSNHLYWLAKGQPGGHKIWSFLDDPEISRQYEARLAALGLTDTLIASFRPTT